MLLSRLSPNVVSVPLLKVPTTAWIVKSPAASVTGASDVARGAMIDVAGPGKVDSPLGSVGSRSIGWLAIGRAAPISSVEAPGVKGTQEPLRIGGDQVRRERRFQGATNLLTHSKSPLLQSLL